MAIGRNSHVASGKVLNNLLKYADHLQREIAGASILIQQYKAATESIGATKLEYKKKMDDFKAAIDASQTKYDKYSNLMRAVNTMLAKFPISAEQQQLLINDAQTNVSDPDTKQFIASYSENYINAEAKAFFESTKGSAYRDSTVNPRSGNEGEGLNLSSTNKR